MQSVSVICPFMGFSSFFCVHQQNRWQNGQVLNALSSKGWQCVFWVGATLEWQSALPGAQKRALSVFGRKAHGSLRAYKHSNSTISPEPDVLMFNCTSQCRKQIQCCLSRSLTEFHSLLLNVSGLICLQCMAMYGTALQENGFFRHSFIIQLFKEPQKSLEHFLVLKMFSFLFLRNTIRLCQDSREIQTLKVIFPDSKAK